MLLTALSAIGSALLLALVLAGFVLAGAALARRFAGGLSQTEIALDILVMSTALAMFAGSLLVLLQLARLPWLVLTALALGGVALLRHGRAAPRLIADCARAGVGAVAHSPLLWLAALLGAVTLGRGLSIPQASWDGLTYHLSYPASWIKHGGVVRFEGGGVWESYETFPKGNEVLYFIAMLPFGRDYLVNVVNVPFWIGLGLAVRAACQRLGLSARGQDLTALIAMACPTFFAYVTPAYVEVAKGFAFAAAAACGLRALVMRSPLQLVPMFVACGIGVAIKLTSLSWLPWPILCALFVARHAPAAALRGGALGALAGGLCAIPWYVHNVAICSNPIYPAALPGLSTGPGAGSLAAAWAMRESSVLAQASWGLVLDYLLIPPWHSRYPLGPGWLYPGALVTLPLLLLFARGKARWLAFGLLGLSLHELVIYLVTPWNGVYVVADTRFLGPSLIAAVLGCAAALAGSPRWVGVVVGVLGLLNALAFLRHAPAVDDPNLTAPGLLMTALALMLLAAAALGVRVPEYARRARSATFALAAAALLAMPWAFQERERGRFAFYETGYDLHPLPGPSKTLWRAVAELPPSRIAFSAGGIDSTEGWFFYPLFGPDLRHDVSYVDIEADGEQRACHRRGMIMDAPDRAAWLARLQRLGIEYVALRGEPIEHRWISELPEHFTRAVGTQHGSLYRVLPKPAAAAVASRDGQ